jgi:hypothetical protein
MDGCFRNICYSKSYWSMAKLSTSDSDQNGADRGNSSTQTPRVQVQHWNSAIACACLCVHSSVTATTNPTTTAAAANSSALTKPTATRSSIVECMGPREREEAHTGNYDRRKIWYDSDLEPLPSIRLLMPYSRPQVA